MASGNSLQIQELPVSEPLKGIKEQHQPKQSSAMTRRGAYAALSYMACAVLLVIFNKAAISSYDFPCANVITLFQMTSSCLLLYALRYWKIISFNNVESEEESFSTNPASLVPLKTLIHTLPLALSYLLYMLASMESMRGGFISVAIIILGALVAGARDLSFDFYSYAVVFISNICTAIYLASVARVGKSSGLNSFGLMWCNGLLCGPILLCWTFISGDLEVAMNFQHLSSFGFQVVMLLSCIMAFLLNYSVFLNTTLNSALTQTICGNLKDLFTIGFGWLLFGGLPFDLLNVVGQSFGFLGSCLYAYCKLTGK